MLKKIGSAFGGFVAACGRGVGRIAADVIGLGAVGFISYGAWLIYEPAGFIVGGVLVLAGVLLASAR